MYLLHKHTYAIALSTSLILNKEILDSSYVMKLRPCPYILSVYCSSLSTYILFQFTHTFILFLLSTIIVELYTGTSFAIQNGMRLS